MLGYIIALIAFHVWLYAFMTMSPSPPATEKAVVEATPIEAAEWRKAA